MLSHISIQRDATSAALTQRQTTKDYVEVIIYLLAAVLYSILFFILNEANELLDAEFMQYSKPLKLDFLQFCGLLFFCNKWNRC